jgi:Helix-turn-helix domain
MFIAQASTRQRREKVFGPGRHRPMDRNAKVRLLMRARLLSRRTEPGKHYGRITAKDVAVLEALAMTFHNAADGRCFPSLARLAEAAACSRSTAAKAVQALEAAGLLEYVHRIARIRWHDAATASWRWRVIRTSNAYQLAGSATQKVLSPSFGQEPQSRGLSSSLSDVPLAPSPLEIALARLGQAVEGGIVAAA